MVVTDVSEAKAQLSKLLDKVSRGEEVLIGKAGRPIARLVPYEVDQSPRVLDEAWAGLVEIGDDFDDLPIELVRAFEGSDEPSP